jgi:hypothetical protein
LGNTFGQFPVWWRQANFKPPSSNGDGPFQYAYPGFAGFFDYIQKNPPYDDYFNKHMGGYHQGRPSWMDDGFYPVQQRLVDGFDTSDINAVLLVDIGGNVGHDIDEFRRKHPDAPGRLVLQDLPIVIDQIKDLEAMVEPMAYDFLNEQPIKGEI